MEKQLMGALPSEVAKIAENVSIDKRNEVQNVLNSVFNGVEKMREQLDNVSVADENDKTNMKLANTIRLGVRQVRLDAEKTFDAKRNEVQQQMLSYKTEDSLWLKAKQTMQILTKEIEENARWKEETKERFEKEQKELKVQQRIVKVSKFNPELHRAEFENMSDEMFDLFLGGVEKAYKDMIEAEQKAEEERIENARLEAERIENQRLENEALKKAAAEKEKQLQAERAKVEKEREEAKRLAAELKAKEDLERKIKEENEAKIAAELKAKQIEDKKAKAAPDKIKLLSLADAIDAIVIPELKSSEAIKISSASKELLLKVSNYIREKTESI